MPQGQRSRLYNDLLRALALSLDLDEGEKLHHAWRVGILSHRIAEALALPAPGRLFHAGLLHDIGGIGLRHHTVHLATAGGVSPDAVKHVFEGVHILQPFEPFRPMLSALMDHHERYDGKGYPHGKGGDRISTPAGILHLADLLEVRLRNDQTGDLLAVAHQTITSASGTVCRSDIAEAAASVLRGDPGLVDSLYDLEELAAVVAQISYRPPELDRLTTVEMLSQLFWLFARIIDAKHTYTAGHTLRVAYYAVRIAGDLQSDQLNRWDVLWAALLHDVGKLGVPRNLLEKPGKLTELEWQAVRKHANDTIEIIGSISDLSSLGYAAASHHEHYDGTGYPRQTAGEDIPLIGRILAYADAYDAMTSDRAYRRSLPHAEAMRRLRKGVGSQFDPHLAEVALSTLEHHGVATAALPTNMEEFHEFFLTDTFDLQPGSTSQAASQVVRPVGRGVLLLELEPWQAVTLSEDLEILAGRRPLEQLISTVSASSILEFLDDDGGRYLREMTQILKEGEVVTRYLFAPSGKPLEVIISRRSGGFTLLYRTAENRLQSIKRMALFYRNFLNSAEAVCFLDMEFRILDVNRTFLNLYGYKLKEVVGTSPMDLLLESDSQDHGLPFRPGVESHVASWSGEMVHRDQAGEPVDVHVTVTAIRDAKGTNTGYIMHASDIRERKRSEARMAALNRCLLGLGPDFQQNVQRILETLGSGLGALSLVYRHLDGGTLSPVARWGRGVSSTPVDVQGTDLCEVILRDNASETVVMSYPQFSLRSAPMESADLDQPSLYLGRITRLGDLPVGVVSALFDKSRGVTAEERDFFGSLASALSTEESRRAADEGLRVANRELERLSRRKSELVAITSHDLKSPLAAMIGYADLLGEGLPDIEPERSERYLQRITAAGNKLLGLIDDILDLERLESGSLELTQTPASLPVVLQECLEINRSVAREHGITLAFHTQGQVDRMSLDVVRMEQVFNNLLSNAIKFSPTGGAIEVTLDGSQTGVVQVRVCDRGPGIPQEALQTVFDRYYQATSARPRAGGSQGAGLGLNIVRYIIEKHGGRVWAQNRDGGGARFTVELPVPEAVQIPVVLLVDADGATARAVGPILGARQVDWAAAQGPQEAAQLFGEGQTQLVFIHAAVADDLSPQLERMARASRAPVLVLLLEEIMDPPPPFDHALSLPVLASEVHELLEEVRLEHRPGGK